MNDGHIIEQGKHEELLKKNGFYHNLYYSQFENQSKQKRFLTESFFISFFLLLLFLKAVYQPNVSRI